MARSSDGIDGDEARFLEALAIFDLPRFGESADSLRAARIDRSPFDVAGWELIARAGVLGETVIGATGQLPDGPYRALSLDEALNGGLLV
jgi:hypothetical protein